MKRGINSLRLIDAENKRRSLAVILTAVIATVAIIAVAAVQSPGESVASGHPARSVSVAAIKLVPESGYRLERRFVGRVEAQRAGAVGFESGGLLAEIRFDEGERVDAGVVMARLDTARLEAQRIELIAAHKAAKAQLELASQTLKRLEAVVDRGLASNQQLDEAREQYRSAKAAVELARARTDSIDVDLAKSELIAPFDAIITRRHVDEGRVVASGEAVLELQEFMASQIRVGVAGPLVASLTEGQTHQLDVNGISVKGTIKAVLPVRTAGTRTVDIILALNQARDGLRDGDLVTLHLVEMVHQPGYWIPLDALTEGMRGLWSAYVLSAQHHIDHAVNPDVIYEAVPHVVEIVHAESDRVFVSGDLPAEALVISTGVHKVVPGQLVRIADERVRVAGGRV